MRRPWALAGVLILAGACASPPAPQSPLPLKDSSSPRPATTPARSVPPLPKDACGASELQRLVGRPRTEIPVPIDPDRQRVACTTCPVTLDERPDRLNFFFDAQTGVVREVKCG